MDKTINTYIGDIVASLIREAAFWKTRYEALEASGKEGNEKQSAFIGTEDSQSAQTL